MNRSKREIFVEEWRTDEMVKKQMIRGYETIINDTDRILPYEPIDTETLDRIVKEVVKKEVRHTPWYSQLVNWNQYISWIVWLMDNKHFLNTHREYGGSIRVGKFGYCAIRRTHCL